MNAADEKRRLLARIAELEERLVALRHRNDDLKQQLDAARQTVGYEQDRQRTHALTCRRPAGGWPPIAAVDDVPTGTAL